MQHPVHYFTWSGNLSIFRPVLCFLYIPRMREHPSSGTYKRLIQLKTQNFQEFRGKQDNNESETVKLGSFGHKESNISNVTFSKTST